MNSSSLHMEMNVVGDHHHESIFRELRNLSDSVPSGRCFAGRAGKKGIASLISSWRIDATNGNLTRPMAITILGLFSGIFSMNFCLVCGGFVGPEFTYELAFSPVIAVGCIWFVMVGVGAARKDGWPGLVCVCAYSILMFFLANAVDLAMIKLDAWHFNEYTNQASVSFPAPLDRNVFGKPIRVPLIEIFGFNGSISWFIYFCNAAANTITSGKN